MPSGSIDIIVTGGTGIYSYLWNDGDTQQNRTQLASGYYSITVTDDAQCTASENIFISQPDALVISETHEDISCAGDNTGSIDIYVTGGVFPYVFSWNDGISIEDRAGLAYGFYSVTVEDHHSCTASIGVSLREPPPLHVAHTFTNAGCNGVANGTIDITVSGGTGVYSYIWSDGATTEDRTNLTAGNYQVTITDSNNCSITTHETINEHSSFTVDLFSLAETCAGKADGSIRLQHIGGSPPFSYRWSNGTTTQDIANIAAGQYMVTVTDANNCSVIDTVVVDLLSNLSMIADVKNASCIPLADGQIELSVSGGRGPFSYQWSNGIMHETNGNLPPGSYSVTITDSAGCSITASFEVVYEYFMNVTVTATGSDTIIRGESVLLHASSDVLGVDYTWSPIEGLDCTNCSTPVARPNESKVYQVLAISPYGCTASDSIEIIVIDREQVVAPNSFSPNGDGVNDEFMLNGITNDVETFYVVIYDRWGEKLFDSYDPNFRWNGTYKGKVLMPGVYVYHMKYKLKNVGKLHEQKGSITLIR